jgi:hypothetical protein
VYGTGHVTAVSYSTVQAGVAVRRVHTGQYDYERYCVVGHPCAAAGAHIYTLKPWLASGRTETRHSKQMVITRKEKRTPEACRTQSQLLCVHSALHRPTVACVYHHGLRSAAMPHFYSTYSSSSGSGQE